MHVTNVIAGVATGGLGWYLLRRAPRLATEEQEFFKFGSGFLSARIWSYRFGGAFLLVLAGAFFVTAV